MITSVVDGWLARCWRDGRGKWEKRQSDRRRTDAHSITRVSRKCNIYWLVRNNVELHIRRLDKTSFGERVSAKFGANRRKCRRTFPLLSKVLSTGGRSVWKVGRPFSLMPGFHHSVAVLPLFIIHYSLFTILSLNCYYSLILSVYAHSHFVSLTFVDCSDFWPTVFGRAFGTGCRLSVCLWRFVLRRNGASWSKSFYYNV